MASEHTPRTVQPLRWLFGADATFSIQIILGYIMVGLMLLSILSGFAEDIQRRPEGSEREA
jgi:hypothetical protein